MDKLEMALAILLIGVLAGVTIATTTDYLAFGKPSRDCIDYGQFKIDDKLYSCEEVTE